MSQNHSPSASPMVSRFTLACVVAALLFGPSADGSTAPAATTNAPVQAGLLQTEAAAGLVAAFCGRTPGQSADLAALFAR